MQLEHEIMLSKPRLTLILPNASVYYFYWDPHFLELFVYIIFYSYANEREYELKQWIMLPKPPYYPEATTLHSRVQPLLA